ncbi:UNKNOWN [Stylonychia lemnae]|uniref:Uncharacterized protein n=1 Tax=Stylonychia lemnae TaxID=5949 RepID=A0A078BA47_STYLE|nr:UNKNOWN [Stylonychia lemnae]|eukprot:CDW90393.1 UNKNOWN [Stylonychia lemnae]
MWSKFGDQNDDANEEEDKQNNEDAAGFDDFQDGWAQPQWAQMDTNNVDQNEMEHKLSEKDKEEDDDGDDWASQAFQQADTFSKNPFSDDTGQKEAQVEGFLNPFGDDQTQEKQKIETKIETQVQFGFPNQEQQQDQEDEDDDGFQVSWADQFAAIAYQQPNENQQNHQSAGKQETLIQNELEEESWVNFQNNSPEVESIQSAQNKSTDNQQDLAQKSSTSQVSTPDEEIQQQHLNSSQENFDHIKDNYIKEFSSNEKNSQQNSEKKQITVKDQDDFVRKEEVKSENNEFGDFGDESKQNDDNTKQSFEEQNQLQEDQSYLKEEQVFPAVIEQTKQSNPFGEEGDLEDQLEDGGWANQFSLQQPIQLEEEQRDAQQENKVTNDINQLLNTNIIQKEDQKNLDDIEEIKSIEDIKNEINDVLSSDEEGRTESVPKNDHLQQQQEVEDPFSDQIWGEAVSESLAKVEDHQSKYEEQSKSENKQEEIQELIDSVGDKSQTIERDQESSIINNEVENRAFSDIISYNQIEQNQLEQELLQKEFEKLQTSEEANGMQEMDKGHNPNIQAKQNEQESLTQQLSSQQEGVIQHENLSNQEIRNKDLLIQDNNQNLAQESQIQQNQDQNLNFEEEEEFSWAQTDFQSQPQVTQSDQNKYQESLISEKESEIQENHDFTSNNYQEKEEEFVTQEIKPLHEVSQQQVVEVKPQEDFKNIWGETEDEKAPSDQEDDNNGDGFGWGWTNPSFTQQEETQINQNQVLSNEKSLTNNEQVNEQLTIGENQQIEDNNEEDNFEEFEDAKVENVLVTEQTPHEGLKSDSKIFSQNDRITEAHQEIQKDLQPNQQLGQNNQILFQTFTQNNIEEKLSNQDEEDGFDDFEDAQDPYKNQQHQQIEQTSDKQSESDEDQPAWANYNNLDDNNKNNENENEDDNDGFDDFEDAPTENQQTINEEPKLQVEEDDYEDFDDGQVKISTSQNQPLNQQVDQKNQDDEDEGFDDFEDAEDKNTKTIEVQQEPQIIQQSASIQVGQLNKKDPNKINTLLDIYQSQDLLKEHLQFGIMKLVKSQQTQSYLKQTSLTMIKEDLPLVPSVQIESSAFGNVLNQKSQPVKQNQNQINIEAFETYTDNQNKQHSLISFKDFIINVQYDCTTNDTTSKFALSKKNKQQNDALFSLKFSMDEDQGQIHQFERKIKEQSQASNMKWDKNIFRENIVQKYKIKLPSSLKAGESSANSNKELADANIEKIQQMQKAESIIQTDIMSPITRTNDHKNNRQLAIQTNKLEAKSTNNPDSAKPSRSTRNKINFIDENMDGAFDDNDEDQPEQTGQRVTTTYYSEDEAEESKDDGVDDFLGAPQVQIIGQDNKDFVKDTFAKFGLNMNLYNPGESMIQNAGPEDINLGSMATKRHHNEKVQRILDILPDYGFMLDTKLALPQTFFME